MACERVWNRWCPEPHAGDALGSGISSRLAEKYGLFYPRDKDVDIRCGPANGRRRLLNRRGRNVNAEEGRGALQWLLLVLVLRPLRLRDNRGRVGGKCDAICCLALYFWGALLYVTG